MKKWIDLSSFVNLAMFPWTEIAYGIARSKRILATYTGDEHQMIGFTENRFKDREEWRWYNVISAGVPVNGLIVPLNEGHDYESWDKRTDEPIWTVNENMRHFQGLQDWIRWQSIFKSTGRQLFFIQLNEHHTTSHQDVKPGERADPVEFMWITPKNGKRLVIGNELVESQCLWFDNTIPHETPVYDRVKWSFRVEGRFTDEFKQRIGWET